MSYLVNQSLPKAKYLHQAQRLISVPVPDGVFLITLAAS